MFSTDRDLLAIEPSLFIDIPLAGHERLRVSDAAIEGATLTSEAANFIAAQIDAGAVLLVASDDGSPPTPIEVTSRTSANELEVSRLRNRRSDAAIPPGDGEELELAARTFAPQAAVVNDCLLRMVGIDPDDANSPITSDMIVSTSVMANLEALGTLERVYAAAIALTGDNGELWKKAAAYHRRFTAGCRVARIRLDLDGDGKADFTRELGLIQFVRR